ncbi:putative MATE family efflux protein [Paenibacillus shirakamiensis]|uniref:MATE family efflux protein n=1 Tax=Paenibacillus shirakamiensis TaxID=1265935 RepID=A0ABS4JHQ7_9BACL|nr:MATE family efflux transporter [Paenibacillus shirakamiensis]MBP2001242.1 putative MATE family efflux protein [Paenibacillus shirakamiensis]
MKKLRDRDPQQLTMLALTWPIFVEVFMLKLIGVSGVFMLSHLSDHAVAAVGVANQVLTLITVIFGVVSIGTGIIVAQWLGAKEEKEAVKASISSILFNLGIGIVISGLIWITAPILLHAMGISLDIYNDSLLYLRGVGACLFLQAIVMSCSAVLRNYGRTKHVMFVMLGMNIIVVCGNYLCIYAPFGWPILGIQGVMYSTIAGQGIAAITLFFLFLRTTHTQLRECTDRPQHVRKILQIGIPSALEQISYNASQFLIFYFIASMGVEAVATRVYLQNIAMFIPLFAGAMGQGTQIRVAYLVGASLKDKAYNLSYSNLKLALLLCLIASTGMILLYNPLIHGFTTNQTVIKEGKILIGISLILELGRTFNLILTSSLRGAGDIQFPVVVGMFSMWGIGASASFYLGSYLGLGLVGIWIAACLDEWIRGLFMCYRWTFKKWMKQTVAVTNEKMYNNSS